MILVFGGTTEGRRSVEVLDEAGTPYFYSTKTGEQDIAPHHGLRLCGALDGSAMKRFCESQSIRLIVDAAHPFASVLHQTIADVALSLAIPVVRYERIFPPRQPDITWIDDYDQLPSDIHTLLATTGVQTISRLKPLEQRGLRIFYRILPREGSIRLAHQQGANDHQLCYYEEGADEETCLRQLLPDAILLKESGLSGGFMSKVEAARRLGIRIFALKRPQLPPSFHIVNGPHGLRRAVEHLLPEFFPLHSGLTTGTCATAAAIAATHLLNFSLSRTSFPPPLPSEVPVLLPDGETIHVAVGYGDDYAYCTKEAGDDPDVTDGLEIRAHVQPSDHFEITAGEGIGIFTLPGFDFPPGSPAINRTPREMIHQNLLTLYSLQSPPPLKVTISAPQGKEIARRTFNPRLGIEGGISIIGVSGIVKPFSEQAFIESIRRCMQVAKASGTKRIVINSGAKSERFVKALYPDLPQQAFVEYGNYIGETLRMAHELRIPCVTLGVMLGKAVKLAAGHLDTHSRKSAMDKAFIHRLLREASCDIDLSDITLARELWERIPANKMNDFATTVVMHCEAYCRPLLPEGTLTILLITDDGHILPSLQAQGR